MTLAKIGVLLLVLVLAAACGEEDTGFEQMDAGETWRGLTVAPEDRCAPYDRRDYPYNSRLLEEVLVRELGGVYLPYTAWCFADRREIDVEHMIALSEAHDSGLCGRSLREKARFAVDPLNLTLATPAVNRQEKGHHDASGWLPEKNRCWFAARVVAVRQKYDLTIDPAEAQTLEQVLAACDSADLVVECDSRE